MGKSRFIKRHKIYKPSSKKAHSVKRYRRPKRKFLPKKKYHLKFHKYSYHGPRKGARLTKPEYKAVGNFNNEPPVAKNTYSL